MRILLRRLHNEKWQFSRPEFEINDEGEGHALYRATGPERSYTLIAFAHNLPDDLRSDRVIAEAWDATFTLYDGIPSRDDIERLRKNVPYQEAGRISDKELTMSRANRSARMFGLVVGALAKGEQPDAEQIEAVGYLMRTTAVYGSGKFGAADYASIADRPEFEAPFQAEMLTVYLIRAFVGDLIDHLAFCAAPESAVKLDLDLKRRFGIGNSTGLGMAPFLINHPALLNNWILARETAHARVQAIDYFAPPQVEKIKTCLALFDQGLAFWPNEHPVQREKLDVLIKDIGKLTNYLENFDWNAPYPAKQLCDWADSAIGEEGVEALISLLMEPFGAKIDELSATMSANEELDWPLDGRMSLAELMNLIEEHYDWALDIDWSEDEANARIWYVSAEKLEPRLGEKASEPIEDYALPLAPGQDVNALIEALGERKGLVAEFLLVHPEYRGIVRRIQMLAKRPYAELRDNTVCATLVPVDMLRCKLSFFGATRFDPRSDRWLRINMFKDAPLIEELENSDPDAWVYGCMT